MSTFEFAAHFLPPGSRVVAFKGREALNEPFEFDVYVNVPNGDLCETADWLQSKATLDLKHEGATAAHAYHGIVASVELVRSWAGHAIFALRLVPQLFMLSLGRHSRVFTHKSIEDILTEILSEYGLEAGTDFEFKLAKAPAVEAHVTQYKETDLEFFNRWCEREGWAYFFDFTAGTDKLTIVDAISAHPTMRAAPVRYVPQPGQAGWAKQSFAHFAAARRAQPQGVVLRDYDYAQPSQALQAEASVGDATGKIVAYGQRAFTSGDVSRLAELRAELLKTTGTRFSARGSATHVVAGFTFDLSEHPHAERNATYLVVEARHFGQESPQEGIPELAWGHADVYRVEVVAASTEVPFRPALRTAWPKVDGYQNAIVDGAGSSPYAMIDGDGRYAVKFHFDEGTGKDGKASTWVRMAQPHGGGAEGFHFPLRKGTEVLCAFLGGDPDRPVIVGVVPNAETPSPVVASNRSQNIVQTGAASYITIEDQAGAEYINLFTPNQKSGLYLGVGRGSGGRSLTSNAAPDVPPEGPGGLGLGPFSFDLRTDGGHGQVHTGGDFNLKADGNFQRIARAHTNITNQATLDYDALSAVEEDYHAKHTYGVEGDATVCYKNELDFRVSLTATELYRNTLDVQVVLHTKKVFKDTLDCTVSGGLRTSKHDDGFNQVVDGDATDTITGGETVCVTGVDNLEVHGNLTETIHGNYALTVDGLHKIKQANTHFHTFSSLWSFDWQAGEATIYRGSKIDLCMPIHTEIWLGTHDETVESLNFALTGAQLEAAPIKMFFGQVLELSLAATTFQAVGVDIKMTKIATIHMAAAELWAGGARLANHLFRLFI